MDKLEQWLDKRGNGTGGIADAGEQQWDRLAARIAEILRKNGEPAKHPDLTELREWFNQRKTNPDGWVMPAHLLQCPVCLEAFEVLVEGVPEISPESRSRYRQLFEFNRPHARGIAVYWPQLLATAAVLTIIAGVFSWGLYCGHVPLDVQSGRLQVENRIPTTGRASVTAGELFVAVEPARTVVADGIALDIDRASRVAFHRTPRTTVVTLASGGVSASVPPRKQGRRFAVKTALGDVFVTGTKFRVSTGDEPSVEYRNDGEGNVSARELDVASVTVLVEEGTVLVRNKQETARVEAGYHAVLRAGQPRIDVTKTALLPRNF